MTASDRRTTGNAACNIIPPIVAIGASAGGLEPLEEFLRHLPPDSGMAFVVIQHLEQASQGFMPELLQRWTTMPVRPAADEMALQANCVYLAPPNCYLSLLKGVLHLFTPSPAGPLRLPIDFFFRSLAADRKDGSIAVVMSGTGYDGTAGAGVVKELAGLVLVQSPESARFSGMPQSAIDAGVADLVGTPGELARHLLGCGSRVASRGKAPARITSDQRGALDKIIILLRGRTGHDFSPYRENTLCRRLDRRMAIHQIDTLATYQRYLQENPHELDLLFRELLIGITSFFRDPQEWDVLERVVIPELLASRPTGGVLRVWAVGCSTGEEAYSLAIAFHDALERAGSAANYSLQIFATDLDLRAIERARRGLFPASIAEDISDERLARYFTPEGAGYRVDSRIREMITFAQQNVIVDPPLMKLDLLVCRNLLVYLESDQQKRLLPLFHYALRRDSFLFLGTAESVGTFDHLFAPVAGSARVYRRLETVSRQPVEFPSVGFSGRGGADHDPPPPSLQNVTDQWLLRHYTPAAVVTRQSGDIVYINGRVGKYLELCSGKMNLNLFAMAGGDLGAALPSAFATAARQHEPVSVRGIGIDDDRERLLDVTVELLARPEPLRGLMLVVFAERSVQARRKGGRARADELEQKLQQAREALQMTRVEMQSAQEDLASLNEEMQSANEELQSANEELESTNEELANSKEELQTMNEALETAHLRQREQIEALTAAKDDAERLIDGTGVATVFLDANFRVRRFTPVATHILNLIPLDIGRPLSDLNGAVSSDLLLEEAAEAVRGGLCANKIVSSREGRRYLVRIAPLRTAAGEPSGVALTFTDITFVLAREGARFPMEASA